MVRRPDFALQCTHQSVSDLHKLTPSVFEGINLRNRLMLKCVRCSAKIIKNGFNF